MSYLTGEFPVSLNGRNIGSVTIAQEGLLTAFACVCTHDGPLTNDPNRVFRLAAVCGEVYVPLGVMIPQGGSLRLKKKYSKSGLQSLGYCDTDTFVLVTKAELEAAQRAAAIADGPTMPADKTQELTMPAAPPAMPEIKDPPAQIKPDTAPIAPSAPSPQAQRELPPPPPQAQNEPPDPQQQGQKEPPAPSPQAQKAAPDITAPQDTADKEKSIPSPAPKEQVKDDSSVLNVDSTYAASAEQNDGQALKTADSENILTRFPADSPKSPQNFEHSQDSPQSAPAPLPKSDAISPQTTESDIGKDSQESLNDNSKLLEALTPALDKLFSALSAQNQSQETADKQESAPDTQEDGLTVGQTDAKGDESTCEAPHITTVVKEPDEYIAMAAKESDEDTAPHFDDGAEGPDDDAADDTALGKPLIGGWRPAPPLSQLFEDPTIYEERETISDALVTEQDGFTLLAVPLSPDEPFALMSIFCFGYPTQIADKEYILFKINDGVLAL
jgi:hypothetical protein